MLKKCVSLLLAAVMVFGVFTVIPFSTSAEEVEKPSAELSNDDMSISGTNSLGTMLAEKYEESATEAENTGSGIYAVEVDGKTARVDARALVDAQLVVSIFDEEGKTMYGSGMTDVTPDDSIVELTLEVDTMPQYFLIRAFLLDKITNLPLCKQFENDYYTQKMQEFFSKTTDDFDEDKVLNLDDNEENNFLVYNEDTIRIENEDENTNVVAKADDKNKEYIIENIDDHIASLKAGDIFSYDTGDGNLLIIKISSIKINGSTATIVGDEVKPEDVFDYIRLDVKEGAGEATVDNSELGDNIEYLGEDIEESLSDDDIASTGLELVDIDATLGTSLSYKLFERKSGIKVDGKIGVKIEADIKFYYDAHLFEDDELEVSAVIKYELSAALELELKNKQEVKIPIGRIEMSPVPGLLVRLTPAFILEGKLTLKLKAKIKGQVGFAFEYGQATDKTKAPTIETELKVSGELFIGLSLAPEIAILGDLASAELDARAGVKLTAEMKYSSDQPTDEIHHCSNCVDGDIFFAIKLKFKFSLLRNENLTWNFDMLNFDWKLGDFYYSFDTGHFAFTECPNKSFKQTITLLDKKYKPLIGASINGIHTDNKGVAEIFLPNGKTALKISKDGKEVIRWHYIDHAGRFTMVIDFDNPDSLSNSASNGSNKLVKKQQNSIIDSGLCGVEGSNVSYYLYDSGTLEFTGEGMVPILYASSYPWYNNRGLIKRVYIGRGITYLAADAIYDYPNLKRIEVDEENQNYCSIDGNLYDKSGTKLYQYAIGKLSSIFTVSDKVTSIEEGAFSYSANLKTVNIGNRVSIIKIAAFRYCTGLETISIPDSVRTIEIMAFDHCDNLESIHIGKGVRSIARGPFFMCPHLTSISVDENNRAYSSVDGNLFDKHKTLLVKYANGKKSQRYVIPSSVEFIGYSAFCDNNKLMYVTIPDSVQFIDEYAFSKCSELKEIELPNSVTDVCAFAFYGCTKLEKVILSNAINEIGIYLFSGCENLSSIIIPCSVKYIKHDAFSNCSKINDVYYLGSKNDWNNIVFGSENDYLISANIHFESSDTITGTGINNNDMVDLNVEYTADPKSMVPSAASESGTLVESIALTSEEQDLYSYSLRHLIPDTEAVLIILEGTEDSAVFNAESLLYIAQGTVDEKGSVGFDVQQDFGDISWVAYIFGECDHSSSTWTTAKEPSAGEEGLKVLLCDHCGEALDTEIIAALPKRPMLGDVDGDGDVTVADATVIQRYVIKTDTIAFDEKVADVDGDGIVTIVDATFIQRYSTNVKVPYAIGEEIK